MPANLANSKTHDESTQRHRLAPVDCIEERCSGSLGKALECKNLLQAELIEIRQVPDETSIDQLRNGFPAQSLDIEGRLRREVFDGALQLGWTDRLSSAVEIGAFSCDS